jgi:hypothetical protein
MIRFSNLWVLFICLVLLQSCNTLYNTKIIKIEVIVPGRAKIQKDYKKVAIRYNNSNIASNPFSSSYFENSEILTEKTNNDSIASKIYYQFFTDYLREQQVFDTIIELKPVDFSDIALSDSLIFKKFMHNDIARIGIDSGVNIEVYHFSKLVKNYSSADSNKNIFCLSILNTDYIPNDKFRTLRLQPVPTCFYPSIFLLPSMEYILPVT